MNFFSLIPLFQKKQENLRLPDSLLIKKLKKISASNALLMYENITLYHHKQKLFIPLLILDISRGIFLFEYKKWSFNHLKDATITKATDQDSSNENLAFDKTQKFIKQKFNELTHSDGIALYNFLIMENLSSENYQELDNSLKELLPLEKIIFNNSSELEIIKKLKDIPLQKSLLPNAEYIMSNLLVQYLIASDDKTIHFATKEQIDFINSNINGHKTLYAKAKSGKTNAILLYAILQRLKQSDKKIIIIEPTVFSCDILKQKLINSVERAMIDIDINSIEIITPLELINRHLKKLKKDRVEDLYINDILMQKNFKIADLIMCDDSDLLSKHFILYLKHIQKNSNLLLVNSTISFEKDYIFEKSFKKDKDRKIFFKETNPHAKTLQLISYLLKENSVKDILVISNEESRKKLQDDLKHFIKEKVVLFDSSKHLRDQNLNNFLLTSYNQLGNLDAKFIIMIDICSTPLEQLIYATNLGEDEIYILYENECKDIDNLARVLK